MELSRAVDWWDEWKLRILVLSSTIIQFFLLIYGGVRRYRVPRWFRLCIWLAYLGGDSIAIYALATLFNRHTGTGVGFPGSQRSALEVLWAPILLVHLAGQEQITVYSIEDNQLWRRHVLIRPRWWSQCMCSTGRGQGRDGFWRQPFSSSSLASTSSVPSPGL